MLRTRTLIPLLAVLAAGVLAAPAGAATYCVNSPSCVSGGGTDAGSDGASLASALSSAQTNAGADRVEIGPGSYANAGGFAYSGGSLNPIDIVGAGSDQTTLTNTTTGAVLNVNAAGSKVERMAFVLAPAANAGGVGILGNQSVTSDVAVTDQAGTSHGLGAYVGPNATLKHATITSDGPMWQGVNGAGAVEDSTVSLSGAYAGINGPTRAERVSVRGAKYGLLAASAGPFRIDQAVLQVPAGGIGLYTASTNSSDVSTTADHVTVIGAGDASSEGVRSQATPPTTAHNAKVILRSSIVRGFGHDLSRAASHGAADIEVDHSDFDPATTLENVQPGGSGALTDNGGNLNVDPQFTSATDFHPVFGSPVIDQGAAAVLAGESSTDLDGAPRLFGSATDMGAFENQGQPAQAGTPTPTPGSETTGTDGSADSGTSGETASTVDTPPAETPPVEVPPSDPPVVPVRHKRTCAQIAKAKHGKKARAKAKAQCIRRHRHRRVAR